MGSHTPVTQQYDVRALREQQFPLTRDTVYFNFAAISPLPRRTLEAMQAVNEHLMLDPSGNFEFLMGITTKLKEAAAALINAQDTSEIALLTSTSMGLNLAAQALTWQRGDNILLCDIEFPSNVYPWLRLQEQYGVEVRLLSAQHGGLTVDMVQQAADSHTRLVAASAVQFFSGHRTDLTAIGTFCHEKNILFAVDAIQSAGHIPLDVQAMHIDILSTGGQKSLMGPPGAGFLYARKALADQMNPTIVGPTAVQDFMHWLNYDLTFLPGAARFSTGTENMAGNAGLLASITMLRELGLEAIDAHVSGLAAQLMEWLKAKGYAVVTPDAPGTYGPIVTFRAAETEEATNQIFTRLTAQRIFLSQRWDKSKVMYMRVSLHCFNDQADLDRLFAALEEVRQL